MSVLSGGMVWTVTQQMVIKSTRGHAQASSHHQDRLTHLPHEVDDILRQNTYCLPSTGALAGFWWPVAVPVCFSAQGECQLSLIKTEVLNNFSAFSGVFLPEGEGVWVGFKPALSGCLCQLPQAGKFLGWNGVRTFRKEESKGNLDASSLWESWAVGAVACAQRSWMKTGGVARIQTLRSLL